MFIDDDSILQMSKSMKNYDLFYKLIKSRSSLNRYKSENLIYLSIKKISRSLTIFSHSDLNDLEVMIFRFFNSSYALKLNFIFEKYLYIRLHPSLDKSKANLLVSKIRKKYDLLLPEVIFINTNKESLHESMQLTNTAIFSLSSSINDALEICGNVVSVKTSFAYSSQLSESNRQNDNWFI